MDETKLPQSSFPTVAKVRKDRGPIPQRTVISIHGICQECKRKVPFVACSLWEFGLVPKLLCRCCLDKFFETFETTGKLPKYRLPCYVWSKEFSDYADDGKEINATPLIRELKCIECSTKTNCIQCSADDTDYIPKNFCRKCLNKIFSQYELTGQQRNYYRRKEKCYASSVDFCIEGPEDLVERDDDRDYREFFEKLSSDQEKRRLEAQDRVNKGLPPITKPVASNEPWIHLNIKVTEKYDD